MPNDGEPSVAFPICVGLPPDYLELSSVRWYIVHYKKYSLLQQPGAAWYSPDEPQEHASTKPIVWIFYGFSAPFMQQRHCYWGYVDNAYLLDRDKNHMEWKEAMQRIQYDRGWRFCQG
jgi:hypothetical protein